DAKTEAYVLISVGKAVDPAAITSVGAVDVLGRQGMKDLVADLLGSSPRIERVTKVEDLLPVLQLASADPVLLPERLLESFEARSKLDLRVTRLSGRVGLPCLSALTPAGTGLVDGIRKLGPRINQELGVTKWDSP